MKFGRLLALGLVSAALVLASVLWWSHERSFAPLSAGPASEREFSNPSDDADRSPEDAAPVSSGAGPAISGVFDGFREWQKRYLSSPDRTDDTLLEGGRRRAQQRRAFMAELMERDPEQALREAVTLDVYQSLPESIRGDIEEPFSALGDVSVLPVCRIGTDEIPVNDRDRVETRLNEDTVMRSFVFGRRLALDSKEDTPVQGISLGDQAVLRPSIFHRLQREEVAPAEARYPLANFDAASDFATGEMLGANPVTALSGGRVFKFASVESLEKFERRIAALDLRPGPHSGSSVMFLPRPADPQTGAFNLDAAMMESALQASAWTETRKKIYFIRVDFPDKPNATFPVVSDTALGSTLNTSASNTILEMSYGKTWIEATVSNQITHLSNNSTFYTPVDGGGSSRNDQLHTDAKARFQADNPAIDLSQYDIIGVYFASIGMKGSGITYSGLAGGTRMWLQGGSSTELIVHEIGHNYGLGHASFWVRSSGSTNPIDPAGAGEEYGDPFDVMGDGPVPQGHYHMEAKHRLNWLPAGAWTDVTAAGSGTYRVYRIDHASTTGTRALRITRGAQEYYWIGYRRAIPSNSYLPSGAYFVWQRPGQARSWLIDLTPNSLAGTADRTDGSGAIGKTYADPAANIYITPIGRGGTSPNEYLDVRVNLGAFPGNVAPTVTIDGPSTIDARKTAIFTATAGDANNDALTYSWDFGGAFATDNNASVPQYWSIGGTYNVKVTVSDMKGGTATATKMVTVTDPLNTWTQRANTATGDFKGIAAGGGRVVAVGTDFSVFKGSWAHSPDGIHWTSGQFASNEHMAGIAHDGTKFIAVGQTYNSGWVGLIKTSTDGAIWTQRMSGGPPLAKVASSGSVSVAVADDGVILRSTNGVSWNAAVSGTTSDLTDVTWGNGVFVATGRENKLSSGNTIILTSPDGATWTNRTAGASYLSSWKDFVSVGFGGGKFFTSGWYSLIAESANNGVTWAQALPDSPAYRMAAFASGNEVQFSTGEILPSGTPVNLISPDASNWTPLTTPATGKAAGAAFFQNTFITVGANHSIWQSGQFAPGAFGLVQWRETYFPDHEAASILTGDAEGDSLVNLLEYALARNPLSAAGLEGARALPSATAESIDPLLAGRLAVEIDLPEPARGDMTYIVEVKDDLFPGAWTQLAMKTGTGAWTWTAAGSARIATGTPAGGRVTVTIGDSQLLTAGTRRFMRLRTMVTP